LSRHDARRVTGKSALVTRRRKQSSGELKMAR
jgi:hypothetical protein